MAKSYPTVSVTTDTVTTTRDVSVTVEVVQQFTDQSPAQLDIQFRNTAERSRNFLFGPVVPFGPLASTSESPSVLHVVPADTSNRADPYVDVIPDRPVDGCWQLADRYDLVDRGTRWPAPPGGTTKRTYAVLNDPDTDECHPPGEYPFSGEWGERDDDDSDHWFSWGFALVIHE